MIQNVTHHYLREQALITSTITEIVGKIRQLLFRIIWVVAPCSHVEVDRCFRCAYWLHHRPDDGRQ
jgi:hypothetical protein